MQASTGPDAFQVEAERLQDLMQDKGELLLQVQTLRKVCALAELEGLGRILARQRAKALIVSMYAVSFCLGPLRLAQQIERTSQHIPRGDEWLKHRPEV